MDPEPCLGQRQKKKIARAARAARGDRSKCPQEKSEATNSLETKHLDSGATAEETDVGIDAFGRTGGGSSKYSSIEATNPLETKHLDSGATAEKTDVGSDAFGRTGVKADTQGCVRDSPSYSNQHEFIDPHCEDAGIVMSGTFSAQAVVLGALAAHDE